MHPRTAGILKQDPLGKTLFKMQPGSDAQVVHPPGLRARPSQAEAVEVVVDQLVCSRTGRQKLSPGALIPCRPIEQAIRCLGLAPGHAEELAKTYTVG